MKKSLKIKEALKKMVKAIAMSDMYEVAMFGEYNLVCHPAHINLEQPYFWF